MQNEPAGDFEPAVEVESRQNRFQRIHQQSGFQTSATLFFASPQPQIGPQPQRLRHLYQVPFAHQVSAQLRKLTLAKRWEATEQFLTRYQRQDSVSQELKLLIVPRPLPILGGLLGFEFPRLRAVR